jgi:hypothetical protein
MLRARDAMDRTYAQPLDIPALARIACVSEAHFIPFGNSIRIVERRELPADFVPPAGSFPSPE